MREFTYDGATYEFDSDACYKNGGLIELPDGRVLTVGCWFEVMPPKPGGVTEVKLFPATVKQEKKPHSVTLSWFGTLYGQDVYTLPGTPSGDHSGVYAQIEHVDDLLKVMDSVAAGLIAIERSEQHGHGQPAGAVVGEFGRELLAAIEKLGRKIQ